MNPVYHTPVLLEEVVEGLSIKPSGVYVDCTFGGGGHSKAILSKLDEKGRLIAFDQDRMVENHLIKDDRFLFIPQNFKDVARYLKLNGIEKIDGILADLGVSSHQIDTAERGFSFRFDAPLDMRMDRTTTTTAAKILQQYNEKELHLLFEKYGEVTNAKTLAKFIVDYRKSNLFSTTDQLKNALQPIVKGHPIKYLSKVFQALRIAVNNELGVLEDLLQQINYLLHPKGRAAIISFHSLEDRIVKNFFRGDTDEVDLNPFAKGVQEKTWKLINKKPIEADVTEIKNNPRSKSAKLRIAEKI